ncbi:larval cuticle protein F1 [Prorops nasuta]|uniref:larval cuticle protein F1 n=1 Tax=Prorops nasuta TaxID=863751 RepID=UPI0034CF6EBF
MRVTSIAIVWCLLCVLAVCYGRSVGTEEVPEDQKHVGRVGSVESVGSVGSFGVGSTAVHVREKRAPILLAKAALLGGAALVGKKALLLGGAALGAKALGAKALVGAGLLGAGLYKARYYGGGYGPGYGGGYYGSGYGYHHAPVVYHHYVQEPSYVGWSGAHSYGHAYPSYW